MDADDCINAHVVIPAEAFEELLEDLDTPPRPSILRQLMPDILS